jgi:hypothetical protein
LIINTYANAIVAYLKALQNVIARIDVGEIDAIKEIMKKAFNEERTIFLMASAARKRVCIEHCLPEVLNSTYLPLNQCQ